MLNRNRSLALMLSSHAAMIVVSLGYNRISTMHSDSELERERKIMLFWLTYWLNVSFAIRIGHAPTIRDCDITVPFPGPGSPLHSSLHQQFRYWLTIGRLQHRLVEGLYSPSAMKLPVHERSSKAARYSGELDAAWQLREPAC